MPFIYNRERNQDVGIQSRLKNQTRYVIINEVQVEFLSEQPEETTKDSKYYHRKNSG